MEEIIKYLQNSRIPFRSNADTEKGVLEIKIKNYVLSQLNADKLKIYCDALNLEILKEDEYLTITKP